MDLDFELGFDSRLYERYRLQSCATWIPTPIVGETKSLPTLLSRGFRADFGGVDGGGAGFVRRRL